MIVSTRWFAAIASIVLVAVTLSPVLREPADDGFPLSTYPMFATARPRKLTMSYALGVTRTGERRTLKPRLVGSGEVLQAYMIVAKAVQGGRTTQLALCQAIAERIRTSGDDDIVTVRIITGTHDALDVLLDNKLGRETERVRCEVRT